ncbi:MAG: family 78 glycoside hydrolase catalytic domain [Paludibacter sp.]|jgi:alpha-L-rhamnosidase|nr:family 78 glycoside hydrolase catalytic domain [Paludibacter sp.]
MKKTALLFLFLLHCFISNADTHIINLKCEFLTEPIGVDSHNPRFSWQFKGKSNFQQNSYLVEIASKKHLLNQGKADILISEEINTTQPIAVIPINNLQDKSRYYWRVTVWDKAKKTKITSPASWFETGIKSLSSWKASWITDNQNMDFRPSPLFRKTFTVQKKIKYARLYVSAAGYYEIFLNGDKVSNHILDPGYTHFNKRLLYVTHDVTTLIKNKNCISAVLGNGWYNIQSLAVWNFDQAEWRNRPRFISELEIVYVDGSRETILSDSSWRTATGPYRFNNLYSGEIIDANKEETGWKNHTFDDSNWENAIEVISPAPILESQIMPAIKITEEIAPKSIKKISDRIYVVDFGYNSAGFCRFSVKGQKGMKVTLKYGEKINPEGRLDQNFINKYFQKEGPLVKRKEGAKPPVIDTNEIFQMDTYIVKGGTKKETFVPSFSYKGFQFVEIESSEPIQLTEKDITALFIHTDVKKIGNFSCSSELLTKIYEATMRAYKSNLHSIPTDCPQREKNGWTADAYISIDLALLNYDGLLVYEKWMRDFIDNQNSEGKIAGIVPSAGWGYIDWVGPTWDLAMFVIPDALYRYYGQTRAIEQLYPTLERYLSYLESREKDGMITFGIGDWVPAKTKTPTDFTSMCTYYYDHVLMAKFATLLGKDASPYQRKAIEIREIVNKRYFDPVRSLYANGSQTSYAYPLYIGLAPDEHRKALAGKLNESIMNNNYYLDFGMMGSRYVPRVLSAYGYHETVLKMALKEDEPSWGSWIKKGLTTLPEWFQQEEYDKASLNHVFLGDISAWMLNFLAGIRQPDNAVGFQEIIIQPVYTKQLNSVKGEFISLNGKISSAWERKGNKLQLIVRIPQNCTATVYTNKTIKLGPGNYKFKWNENVN